MKINTVVVVGTQRSGSTWLMQVLSQDSKFRVYGEVFREIVSSEFAGDPALKPMEFFYEYRKKSGNDPVGYLDTVLGDSADKVVCFKVMYDQIRRTPSILKVLSRTDVLVINLYRADLLEVVLSKILARRTGVYHADKNMRYSAENVSYRKVFMMLTKECIKKAIFPSIIRRYSQNFVSVSYEELVQDFGILRTKLDDFLEVAVDDPKATKWKQTPKNEKYSAIENYQYIKKRYDKSFLRRFIG